MGEYPKLENLSSTIEQMSGTQKIPVSDHQNTNIESESFIVDVARLSHISTKELTANSSLKLQRSFSRKGSQPRGSEKKTNPSDYNEREINSAALASPRATLAGVSMLEKPMAVGPMDWAQSPPQAHHHHQITIKTSSNGSSGPESRSPAKRPSFKRSQHSFWAFNPRKIFFFLATLSSMGTMLLIYFTLSMGKLSGDDSAQNW